MKRSITSLVVLVVLVVMVIPTYGKGQRGSNLIIVDANGQTLGTVISISSSWTSVIFSRKLGRELVVLKLLNPFFNSTPSIIVSKFSFIFSFMITS